MTRRTVAIAVSVAIMLSGSAIERANGLEDARVAEVAHLAALADTTYSAEQRTDYLAGAVERAETDTAARAAVLAVRPAFLAELKDFSAALKRAKGKVNTATHRASAVSAQKTVLTELVDPETVKTATATVHALTAKINKDIAAWEAAQLAARLAAQRSTGFSGPVWSSSGPDGYARVRAALDRVGGQGVGLYESASCGGGTAPACANSAGYIKYRADIASWPSGQLNWAMAHELAHIYQFRVWGALNDSANYAALFGSNPESLANCMAVVRGFPGSQSCGAQQRSWASGIWVGSVQ